MKGNEVKVRPGIPVKIPASTWNGVIDLLRDRKRGGKYQTGQRDAITDSVDPRLTIKVKNGLSSGLESFDIVKLVTPLIDVPTLPHAFRRRVSFSGEEPDAADNAIAIMQSPADLDDIATGLISGITPCRVKMNNANHEWANPVAGERRWLESVECGGQARILWHGEDVEFDGSGSVILQGSNSGSATPYEMAVVNLIGAIACEGGGSIEYESNTYGDFSLSGAANAWQSTGKTFNLPSAGDYELWFHSTFVCLVGSVATDYIGLRMNSSAEPGTITTASSAFEPCHNVQRGTINLPTCLYSCTAPRTITLEALRNNGGATVTLLGTGAHSNFTAGYRKVG